jgi:hypothetical protein
MAVFRGEHDDGIPARWRGAEVDLCSVCGAIERYAHAVQEADLDKLRRVTSGVLREQLPLAVSRPQAATRMPSRKGSKVLAHLGLSPRACWLATLQNQAWLMLHREGEEWGWVLSKSSHCVSQRSWLPRSCVRLRWASRSGGPDAMRRGAPHGPSPT